MTRLALAGALVAAALLAGCGGGSNYVPPNEVAQRYVSAIAEGNGQSACALIESPTRSKLLASTHSHISCPALLRRCLPYHVNTANSDQSQLLYVNVDLETHGRHARAMLSGLRIARAIRVVTLHETRSIWRLTSAGRAVERCASRMRHHRRG
jgi:hypothetical protein